MIPVTIKEKYAEDFISLLIEKKKSLLEDISKAQREIDEIDSQIAELNAGINGKTLEDSNQKTKPITTKGYEPSFTWLKKAEFVLRALTVPATTTTIVEELLKIEPALSRKTAIASISSILGVHAKKEETIFTRRENGRGEFIYGLKEWYNKRGPGL